jgi:hypothetical protein
MAAAPPPHPSSSSVHRPENEIELHPFCHSRVGECWEKLVHMKKELLRRYLGRTILSFEELETILCDWDATINSHFRLKPSTPTFLQSISSNDVTHLDAIHASSFNRTLKYLQKLTEHFPQRFCN